MARIRTVKPDFFTSEDIVSLSPFARLLYVALWCEADREGRFYWKPNTFKLRYFPGDKIDIEELCEELLASGLVVRYGKGLAYIPTFLKHQHINPRESKSDLPAPDLDELDSRVDDASARVSDVQVGREGKEGDIARHDATRSAEKSKKAQNREDALVVLEYLNFRADRNFEPLEANLKLITARLGEATLEQCKTVIDNKVAEWGNDPKMSAYLRPATLFNATKFAQYVGDIGRVATTAKPWDL